LRRGEAVECVDNEARDNIGHLWGAFRELAADYWGPDKSNGRRAIIDDHEKRIDSLETYRIKCEEGERMKGKMGERSIVSRGQILTFIGILISCATSFAIAIIK